MPPRQAHDFEFMTSASQHRPHGWGLSGSSGGLESPPLFADVL